MLGELVDLVSKSELREGAKAALKIENDRLQAKVNDLELVMKFQLQSLNDMANKEGTVSNEVRPLLLA